MTGERRSASLRTVTAVVCLVAGALLVSWPIVRAVRSRIWQQRHAPQFEDGRTAGLDTRPDEAPVPDRSPADLNPPKTLKTPRRGAAIARLRIPRVGLDSVIAEGTDKKTLARGPGHMEGTALPGDPDNCIIAGHRDGEFARLASVRQGDVVEIVASGGRIHYRVTTISIIDKSDTTVLEPSSEPLLTLITCYPLRWQGPAPKRLIVRGERIPSPA